MKFQFGKRKNKEVAMMMASRRANSMQTVKRRRAILKKM
jgi:hypothetical protein